jgi:hypothetical protein
MRLLPKIYGTMKKAPPLSSFVIAKSFDQPFRGYQ